MLVCPHCGFDDIIEGVDACEQCHQPLTDLFFNVPKFSVEADLLRDRVGDLPTRPLVEISPETTAGEAIRLMVDRGVGCVLVCEDERLVGVFTERDALMKLGAEAASQLDTPVTKLMTSDPIAITVKDKIAFALQKMDVGGYRHLPVMDGDRVANLISVRGILQYLTEHIPSESGSI